MLSGKKEPCVPPTTRLSRVIERLPCTDDTDCLTTRRAASSQVSSHKYPCRVSHQIDHHERRQEACQFRPRDHLLGYVKIAGVESRMCIDSITGKLRLRIPTISTDRQRPRVTLISYMNDRPLQNCRFEETEIEGQVMRKCGQVR